MQEKPKESETDEKSPDGADAWGPDQNERGYYYDDAHGYEVYSDEDEGEDGSSSAGED